MAEPKLELDDYVDIDTLKQIEDDETKILGYNVAFTRLDGSIITRGSDYTSRRLLSGSCAFLARFPNGFYECQRSDDEACKFVVNNRRSLLYRCRGGFSNFAIPIEIDKRIIACMFGGQFLVLEPKRANQKQHFEDFCRDHEIHLREGLGRVIKDGFFFRGEQIDESQVEEIAKTCGIDVSERDEFVRVYKREFSLRSGRVFNVETFMRDFAHLEVITKLLSSIGQKIPRLEGKSNSEYRTPPNHGKKDDGPLKRW
ncbi:MAG: PocR ligand-binding domain-containing protein [Candidatus Bathyarchaeia archaeon]